MATADSTCLVIQLQHGVQTIISRDDADLIGLNWQTSHKRNRIYIARSMNSTHTKHNTEYLHRVILSRVIGRELQSSEICDHIDNDPLNNCRSNLRIASNKDNIRNGRKRKSASGLKGAYQAVNGKWFSQIMVNRQTIYLGQFPTPEEAHEAYCKAAIEHFGEFARFE